MRIETNLTRCISIDCDAIFPQVQRFRGPNVKIDFLFLKNNRPAFWVNPRMANLLVPYAVNKGQAFYYG